MSKVSQCACGKHYVGSDFVEWEGKRWRARCAFEKALETIKQLQLDQEQNRFLRILGKTVEGLKCPMCKLPLGKQYQVHGDMFYHPRCLIDIGGEG